MRVHVARIAIPCTALALTLAAAVPAAHAQTMYDAAQTVIAPQPVVVAPAATAVFAPPALRTVRTVTTTTTTRHVRHPWVRRRVAVIRHSAVTRHAYIANRVVPAMTTTTTTIATTAPVASPYVRGPLYDAVPPPPPTVEPYDTVPLYDAAVEQPAYDDAVEMPAPAIATAPLAVPVGSAVPAYRYVYQDDRILVIDPNTGIAVQAIPR
jgi:hypothetical protein